LRAKENKAMSATTSSVKADGGALCSPLSYPIGKDGITGDQVFFLIMGVSWEYNGNKGYPLVNIQKIWKINENHQFIVG